MIVRGVGKLGIMSSLLIVNALLFDFTVFMLQPIQDTRKSAITEVDRQFEVVPESDKLDNNVSQSA